MRFSFFFTLFPFVVLSQSLSRPLLKANSVYFRNAIYVFGFIQDKNDLQFKLYKSSNGLQKIDSTSNNLGKEKVEDLLEITADTLHGYLNFYFQKANSKNLASLLRYNDSLKLIAKAEDFESNKINSLTTFENETHTYKNSTYTIRTSEDSLGRQFYLTKYNVISDKKYFEYKQAWQYPLEKRNINTTHVFYADSQVVFIYVTIISGERKGQWILKLNSQTGTIIKGIKLNANGDDRNYIFNVYDYNHKEKELLIAGNIYTKQQFDPETKTVSFTGLTKENTFFFIKIDAAGEVISRDQKIIPITVTSAPKPSGKPGPPPFYHIKIKELKKVSKINYTLYCDVYKSSGQQLLFLYESGFNVDVTLEEMGIEVIAGKIYSPLTPFPNLVNSDLKDINGKIELKSVLEFDKFLYKQPIADVEKQFGTDADQKPKWIINKIEIKSGMSSFYLVSVGLKGIESKLLFDCSKYEHPQLIKLSDQKMLKFLRNTGTGIVETSVLNW